MVFILPGALEVFQGYTILYYGKFVQCLINARRMRTRVTVVCLSVCLSVCLLPIYCPLKAFMQENEHTIKFFAELPRFSTKGFR